MLKRAYTRFCTRDRWISRLALNLLSQPESTQKVPPWFVRFCLDPNGIKDNNKLSVNLMFMSIHVCWRTHRGPTESIHVKPHYWRAVVSESMHEQLSSLSEMRSLSLNIFCFARWKMTRLFAVYIFYQNKILYYRQQNCLFPSASRLLLQTCIVLIGYMCVCYVLGEGEGVSFPCCASAHRARWTLANFLDPDQTAL